LHPLFGFEGSGIVKEKSSPSFLRQEILVTNYFLLVLLPLLPWQNWSISVGVALLHLDVS